MSSNGLQCTGCHRDGFEQLNGKYTIGDEIIIREGEALCDDCARQRDGFTKYQSKDES